jgi:periplasmic divalent cation tolerance protein
VAEALVVLTTVGGDFDAAALARALVDARSAACVNILPGVHSVYRWDDEVQHDQEQLLLIKTTRERLPELREALFASHPYDVPELVVITPTELSERYLAWLVASTT